ncbi:MAG: hypothetical protein XD52_0913 [bacterium 42_11]|nr:MAG: hypothetical protein XD52_0913 [bacterium 42_11]
MPSFLRQSNRGGAFEVFLLKVCVFGVRGFLYVFFLGVEGMWDFMVD